MMTIFKATSCLCLATALALKPAYAFTVAPPVTIDVPTAPGMVGVASASSAASKIDTYTSNLPSQIQLLEKAGSLTLASTADTKAASPAKAAKTGSKDAKAAKKPPSIRISEINFDGKVPKTESDEYVVVQNSSKDTIDVSGYIVYPATTGTQGSTFSFPKGSTIKPNASVRIYTNEIHKETGGYTWKSGKALWSNNGGLAVLKDNQGTKLDEFKYKPSTTAKKS